MFLSIFYYFLFFVISVFPTLSYSSAPSLFDILSFRTDRTYVRPVICADIEQAKEMDNSDLSCLAIMKDVKDLSIDSIIENQEKKFNNISVIDKLIGSRLYYGIFLKEDQLIGLITIVPTDVNNDVLSKKILSTCSKYDKKYRSQGYGTEVKKGIFGHFQKLNLIPSSFEDRNASVFLGFFGWVHLSNTPSLKYNILKSGYNIGYLRGEIVYVYFPFVSDMSSEKYIVDLALHELALPHMRRYILGDVDVDALRESKKIIEKIAFDNLMKVSEKSFEDELSQNINSVVNALAQFPDWFDYLSVDRINLINIMINQEFIHIKSYENKTNEKYIDTIKIFKQAKRNMVILFLKAWIKSNPKLSAKSTR